MKPTEEDIKKWQEIANRRNAILPLGFEFIGRKEIVVLCGKCGVSFRRPLIAGERDPIYVCPECNSRNYIPIDWNVIRR